MGYNGETLRRNCGQYRMQSAIPRRLMKHKPKSALPRQLIDLSANITERMFEWLKENRRIVTRFDKLAKSYGAMVQPVCGSRLGSDSFHQKQLLVGPCR